MICAFGLPSPSHCCARPLKFAAHCRRTHSARPPEESQHNKPAASSSPHFRALSRLYSSSLESEEEESPRTRKALEFSISQGALHCAASISASIPCRRDPNRATTQPDFAACTIRTVSSERDNGFGNITKASGGQGSPYGQGQTYRQIQLSVHPPTLF